MGAKEAEGTSPEEWFMNQSIGASSVRTYRARRRISWAHIPTPILTMVDVGICLGVFWYVVENHPYSHITLGKFNQAALWKIGAAGAIGFFISSITLDLYAPHCLRSWLRILPISFSCAVVNVTIMVGYAYFLHYKLPGRWVIGGVFLLTFACIVALRIPFLLFRKYLRKRIVFLGSRENQEQLEQVLRIAGPYGAQVVAGWDENGPRGEGVAAKDKLEEICVNHKVDEVVLSGTQKGMKKWFPVSLRTVPFGCKLTRLPDLIELETKRVPLDLIDEAWLIGKGWDLRNHLTEIGKRFSDILIGLIGMVFVIVLFPFIALMIRLSGKGPIFYSQHRVGRFGVPFRIWKFRTMKVDAEKDGAKWAKKKDSRVTWIGRVLRKTRLDEIPQFWNILLGNMSLVGPRPERPEFVSELEEKIPYYNCRHLLRPGLTGWAQISYRYGASVEDAKNKLQYDLYYVRHYSMALDWVIILRTAVAVAKGAR